MSLHCAAGHGFHPESTEIARMLLQAGADVNAKSGQLGFVPLHEASGARMLDLLLERGADPTVRNADGLAPLEYMIQDGRTDDAAHLRTRLRQWRPGMSRRKRFWRNLALCFLALGPLFGGLGAFIAFNRGMRSFGHPLHATGIMAFVEFLASLPVPIDAVWAYVLNGLCWALLFSVLMAARLSGISIFWPDE